MRLKSLFYLCFFATTCSNVLAQQTYYSFGYDNNGNRNSRIIVPPTPPPAPDHKSTENQESDNYKEFNEDINDLKIIISPNPTKGAIKITFQNTENQLPVSIKVIDLSGHTLKQQDLIYEGNLIDLSSLPRATYILRINVDGKKSDWKIIKE